jgi:hypothetical protein
MQKIANAAMIDLNNRAGGLLIAKTVNGQKRYQWRRDLPTPLQLELNCQRRRSKKRLKKLSHLVVFTRKNNYHIRQKLDLFDLHRAVESLLLHIIKSLSALNSLQIISRFAAFLLAQFKILDNKKPRVLKHCEVLCVSKNKYSVPRVFAQQG